MGHDAIAVSPEHLFFSVNSEHLYSSVERGTVRGKCLTEEHNTMTWPGPEPGPHDQESSTLTNEVATSLTVG